ncbi:hypothetical protein C8F04DRAFT_1186619 [Mycena alexandri]|uniref:Uncharacterized protein n=1 Tax=Mycena alexandri TaxID=1745969 RepID=A0AAD6SQE9_9AGAR|nr:hypothetical protein C8F04DRAFT_1186619 [Mycena alexandri]
MGFRFFGLLAGPVLSASNRVFTSKDEAPTDQDNDFAEGLDPIGMLAKLKTSNLIHAPENIVQYFDGKVRYNVTVPGITTRLQAVTLLDSEFTKEAAVARRKFRSQPKCEPAIRRKVGYFYDDGEEPSRVGKERQESNTQ